MRTNATRARRPQRTARVPPRVSKNRKPPQPVTAGLHTVRRLTPTRASELGDIRMFVYEALANGQAHSPFLIDARIFFVCSPYQIAGKSYPFSLRFPTDSPRTQHGQT